MKYLQRVAIGACLLALTLQTTAQTEEKPKPKPGLNDETFAGLELRGIGPAFMSGRIADIAIDPSDKSTWYVAVGSGGVWKTTNAGITWAPIFDGQGSFSVGALTIDPNHHQTIWVGTGENIGGRHAGYGDGIYVSRDGGATWKNMGLKKSEHIGMIRIDPRDSNIIFVAAQGPLWSAGGERGLYKSIDGGENWKRVLQANQYTGAGEVHLDPSNPDIMYATTWQRLRTVAALMGGGPESGIHKSMDGGENWKKLTTGLPEEDMGKIGLAISPQRPEVLYAGIELGQRKGGVWKSVSGGESWKKQSDYVAGGTGPHYYQELFASPHQFDRLYHMDVFLHISDDGGKNFVRTKYNDKHVDHHALAFDADDPDYLLVGNDGGLYETFDKGDHWRHITNLPITQFYKVAVDYDKPFYNVYGGTQDNNSQGGPSRTLDYAGILNSDWFITLGGDGHQSAADPDNPDIVYAQWQQGNLSRYDRKTGQIVYIQPQPELGEPADRFNWDSPVLISPHDSATLYFASTRVWRSADRGDSWTAISDDLSRGIDRLRTPIMERQWNETATWDLYAMSMFGTVTSLSESPLEKGLLYAGTDDGLVRIRNGENAEWQTVDKLPGVPDYFFVNDIKADLHDADTVYLAVDNHKNGDYKPYLLKSTDRGKRWRSITGNLPERHLVWRVVQDHVNPDLLFAGTEFGVFFTLDGGKLWVKLTGNAPTIAFRDLVIQQRENDLVGATFGRGFYIFDDYSVLRTIDPDKLATDRQLFPVRETPWYIPRSALGCDQENCKSSRGGAFFAAPNPPFGAVFTYYLPEEIKTAREARHAADKDLRKAGKDNQFPAWDTLTEEEHEAEPAVVLIVKDANGEMVRHVEGPVKAGFHRVAWDLRYPSKEPYDPPDDPTPWNSPPVGPMVAPGSYTVTFATRIDGKLNVTAQTQTFNVTPIQTGVLAGAAQPERVKFLATAEETMRIATTMSEQIDAAMDNLQAAADTLRRSTADPALLAATVELRKALGKHKIALEGDPRQEIFNENRFVSVGQRINYATAFHASNTYGPTVTQRRSLEIADVQVRDLQQTVNPILKTGIPELFAKLDAAGVAWSKGR